MCSNPKESDNFCPVSVYNMQALVLSSIIVVIVCSVTLVVYHHYNRFKRMDRYYYENHRWTYVLSQLCYYIVFVSCILNARYLAYKLFSVLMWRYFGVEIKVDE